MAAMDAIQNNTEAACQAALDVAEARGFGHYNYYKHPDGPVHQ